MIKRGDYYYLFYSGGSFFDNTYAIGIARSLSLIGPYEKYPYPILSSNDFWIGPGHCSVL